MRNFIRLMVVEINIIFIYINKLQEWSDFNILVIIKANGKSLSFKQLNKI